MKATNQIRGNCQLCGHQQATTGFAMAKHGYTVEYGYFSGVCRGDQHAPLQNDRSVADRVIAQVRAEADDFIVKAEKVKAGEISPKVVFRTDIWRNKTEVPFAEATVSEQNSARNTFEWALRGRASAARQFADHLERCAGLYHGTALVEVIKPAKAAPILVGDVKGDRTVTSVEGGRVYYKVEGKKSTGFWLGTQAWRKLAA
jgi:hypothetical protein